MEMHRVELDGGILKLELEGSLDLAGASQIDLPFSVAAGSRDKLLVDLTGVTFLASMGIRVFVKAAKTITRRGGRMVIMNPTDAAQKVLVATGMDSLVPIVANEADARAAFVA
ncbi:MAG: STAS domain-containing protein [Bauldia sp.]|nr:STAS domain-containing protein [Bauldia sp.]